MSKVISVIRRELMERVRTRAFVISTFLMPVFLLAVIVLPAVMMQGGERTSRIALVDGTGTPLGAAIDAGLRAERIDGGGAQFDVTTVPAVGRIDAVRDSLVALTGFSAKERPEGFEGVLVVTPETYTAGAAHYLGSNAGSPQRMQDLSRTLSRVLMRARLDGAGVDPAVVGQALVPARLDADRVSDGKATGQSGMASFAIAYVMGFLLYITILLYGQQTAMSVIEEKTSRIMEVLASSLTPFQMLLGKIVGVGLTGLLQLSIWALSAYLLASQRGAIAGLFGADPAVVSAIAIPPIPGDLLIVFLAYFALGFLIYGAMYATIGSIVNSVQDMQQFIWPVMLPIIVGFFGMFRVINDPNATMGTVFSFIPFFAPFVVPVKWAMGSMGPVQLALSIASMLLGVVVIAWLAGRIYRTGILMYGKKPTFGEIFRWIRAG
jgi:ABC-2 type transport system permease protein